MKEHTRRGIGILESRGENKNRSEHRRTKHSHHQIPRLHPPLHNTFFYFWIPFVAFCALLLLLLLLLLNSYIQKAEEEAAGCRFNFYLNNYDGASHHHSLPYGCVLFSEERRLRFIYLSYHLSSLPSLL